MRKTLDPTMLAPRGAAQTCLVHGLPLSVSTRGLFSGGWTMRNGYRMCSVNGQERYEHVLVWEQCNGPIPAGMDIHHRNGNRLDNRIENLQLLARPEHMRIHSSKSKRVAGDWWKRCSICGRFQPLRQYYPRRNGGVESRCRDCEKRRSALYWRTVGSKKVAHHTPADGESASQERMPCVASQRLQGAGPRWPRA